MTGQRTTIVPLAIGSYTEAYGAFRANGVGVTIARMDVERGTLQTVGTLALAPNPAYLRWHSDSVIHGVLEANDGRAAIVTLGLDQDGGPRLVDQVALEGRVPCHLALDPSGRWLAAAAYTSGHVSVHPFAGGRPGPARTTILHSGASVHPQRQTGPHPHAVSFSPNGRWLLVPDLGIDRIMVYPFEAQDGALGTARAVATTPGSGPRLILFSRDGQHVVLVEELGCRVTSYRWEDGTLAAVASADTTSIRPNTAAGLRWHPSGTVFAASNRGADTIQLFGFAPATGAIWPLARLASGGAKPRDFDFSPCGRWLVVANQDSDGLAVHRLNDDASDATPTGARLAVGSPTCVRFLGN